MKKLTGLAAFGLLLIAPLCAQTPAGAAKPAGGKEFEVASIKEAPPIDPAAIMAGKQLHVGMKIDGAHVDIGGYPLIMLISKAYDVKLYQIQAPDWMKPTMNVKRFDIIANMPAGSSKDDVPQMLQALLRDRFGLVVHEETKEKNVYALVVAKDGLKIKESAASLAAAEGPGVSGSNSASVVQTKNGATFNDGQHTQKMAMAPDGKSMQMEIGNITMAELCESLSSMADRPLVDMTETNGKKYDITLQMSMEDMMAAARAQGVAVPGGEAAGASGRPADAASDPGAGRSIFKSMEAAGLKLDARKMPLKYLVVDKSEKVPSEN
ncbi:MAG TPA: TIGR03435 family protein [Candidatus Limnocylindrales bacterium]|nr:TIGR03435 family protein [Candidatus Limnocylindrales bacterium]